jgi:hypothetical protein
MIFPVELHLFGFQVSAHQILELVAYAAGFQLYLFLRRRWNEGPPLTIEQTAIIFLGIIFGALFGARVLDWAESYPFYWEHRFDPRIPLGGKTIVGALMGGWIGASLAKRRLGLRDRTGNGYSGCRSISSYRRQHSRVEISALADVCLRLSDWTWIGIACSWVVFLNARQIEILLAF